MATGKEVGVAWRRLQKIHLETKERKLQLDDSCFWNWVVFAANIVFNYTGNHAVCVALLPFLQDLFYILEGVF